RAGLHFRSYCRPLRARTHLTITIKILDQFNERWRGRAIRQRLTVYLLEFLGKPRIVDQYRIQQYGNDECVLRGERNLPLLLQSITPFFPDITPPLGTQRTTRDNRQEQ